MAWIRTINENDATPPLSDVYHDVVGRSGRVANILKVQSLDPAGLRDHYSFYRTLMFGASPLSRREREAIAVVISAINGCEY